MKVKKVCTKCGQTLHKSRFNLEKRNRDGYRCECKVCQYKMMIKSLKKKVKALEEEWSQ